MASERRSAHIDATNADRGDCEEETKEDKTQRTRTAGRRTDTREDRLKKQTSAKEDIL